ncbi:MAG: hypothetical protein ACRDM7_20700 [Thermoleophilaceae bacterium]
MAKTWVLDTETKGTGANMVPLENVQKKADAEPRRARPPAKAASARRSRARSPKEPAQVTATALPPGHVRKKATGEIGKIRSVDAKAGTATVHWLKRGAASTVPLSAITRR